MWTYNKGKTIKKKLKVIGAITFKSGLKTLMGSKYSKLKIKYVNVVWHFVDTKPVVKKFKRY